MSWFNSIGYKIRVDSFTFSSDFTLKTILNVFFSNGKFYQDIGKSISYSVTGTRKELADFYFYEKNESRTKFYENHLKNNLKSQVLAILGFFVKYILLFFVFFV